MATQTFTVGAYVKVRNSGYDRAQIAEFRGPLGPKGAHIYKVVVSKKPRPVYIEVREDQLEPLPAASADATMN